MPPFPLALETLIGPLGAYAVFLAIGFAFGWALEVSGFADSPRLAAQFYFRDLTVLKVMFTAVVVAMILVFGTSAVGLLDYKLIWVNPTYLWPGIVGGLIMGVGFVIGGYCPGTSLVAAATARIDGMLFALGTAFGIFLFGETVEGFDVFWTSSYLGRLTLPDLLNVPTGWVVLGVTSMALFMFWGGEKLEGIFGGKQPAGKARFRYAGAALLLVAAIAVLTVGQPTLADRWNRISAEKETELENRAVQVDPDEVLDRLHDHRLNLRLIDVRSEADFNLFHLVNAERVAPDQVVPMAAEMLMAPPNTVFILMSNDETAATQAWKDLVASGVPNAYILAGGVNGWLDRFSQEDTGVVKMAAMTPDQLRYRFPAAYGERFHAAQPNPAHYNLIYEPKIELTIKRGPLGSGCG
jgi:rhodanese-related sulfurtransferase